MVGGAVGAVGVRAAAGDDAVVLARMRTAMMRELRGDAGADHAAFERTCVSFFAAELSRAEGSLSAWIAARGDDMVGSVTLAFFATLPNYGRRWTGRDARLGSVYVAPSWRRRGIARMLVEHAVANGWRLGADRITLGASEMGRPLYESLGFALRPTEYMLSRPATANESVPS